MRNTLKNPFFIAIAAATAIGSACALLTGRYTTDIGQVFVVAGAFMLIALIPTTLIAFLVTAVLRRGTKEETEQASVPKDVLIKRYENQMIWSFVWAVAGIVITIITYLVATNSGGGTYIFCTGAIVFGILSFLQGLFGWMRSQ